MTTPSADMIAAMCGISRKAALVRLRKYKSGKISRERLVMPFNSAPQLRDDRGGNAEWRALGDKPHNERLAAIPGCTATECRVFGIADAAPPEPVKAKASLAQQVADMTGVTLNTARDRVRRFRAGEISLREMYAAPRAEESRRSIDAVCARVGCCRSTAAARLRRFRVGLITEAQLYAPTTGGRK